MFRREKNHFHSGSFIGCMYSISSRDTENVACMEVSKTERLANSFSNLLRSWYGINRVNLLDTGRTWWNFVGLWPVMEDVDIDFCRQSSAWTHTNGTL